MTTAVVTITAADALQSSRRVGLGASGRVEWFLVTAVAVTWGSSFLLNDLGLDGLHPAVVATVRLLLGVAVLALSRPARRAIAREAQLPW